MVQHATISAVQHFCLQDGPGVRSTVFFKGCPLRCAWCHNPESQEDEPQLAFKEHLCIGCGKCVEACEHGARKRPGLPDNARCQRCFACVATCPSTALLRYGESRTVADLLSELSPEFPLYRESGGGVTLSGGEPTRQARFAASLAAALSAEGIHVALETCGHYDSDDPDVSALLSHVDLVLFDVKLADPEAHCRFTGVDNRNIVGNLLALTGQEQGAGLRPRLPLIPGATDGPDNLRAMAGLLEQCGLPSLSVVPYHAMGEARRAWIGWDPGPEFGDLHDEAVLEAFSVLESAGIEPCLAGDEG